MSEQMDFVPVLFEVEIYLNLFPVVFASFLICNISLIINIVFSSSISFIIPFPPFFISFCLYFVLSIPSVCSVSFLIFLFILYIRALKTRSNTPKYGLLFHSTFIGRAGLKNKGRISRYLANKCAIASRIDCFSGKFLSSL